MAEFERCTDTKCPHKTRHAHAAGFKRTEMAKFAAGTKIDFRASLDLPISATQFQVEDWLRFETGVSPMMDHNNPLKRYNMRAKAIFKVEEEN